VEGWWQVDGRLTENYEFAAAYSVNRLFFDGDSVYQASSFFYNTVGFNDEYPNGRYPFVYYGDKEKYKLDNGSLSIYSRPYKSWTSYKINCLNDGKVVLLGTTDTLILRKWNRR
jgi:hypothetical protein